MASAAATGGAGGAAGASATADTTGVGPIPVNTPVLDGNEKK